VKKSFAEFLCLVFHHDPCRSIKLKQLLNPKTISTGNRSAHGQEN